VLQVAMHCFGNRSRAQRCLSVHVAIFNTVDIERHLISRKTMKRFRAAATEQWRAAIVARA